MCRKLIREGEEVRSLGLSKIQELYDDDIQIRTNSSPDFPYDRYPSNEDARKLLLVILRRRRTLSIVRRILQHEAPQLASIAAR